MHNDNIYMCGQIRAARVKMYDMYNVYNGEIACELIGVG